MRITTTAARAAAQYSRAGADGGHGLPFAEVHSWGCCPTVVRPMAGGRGLVADLLAGAVTLKPVHAGAGALWSRIS